jgi:hypothetical protein
MHIGYWWERQTERDHWEDQGIGSWTRLKWNLQGNGPIRHVETCPDFFSLREYTQQNPLSKF